MPEPRLRGDGPEQGKLEYVPNVRTPPTRGWTLTAPAFFVESQQNPAYAGMDLILFSIRMPGSSEPRLRGDGPDLGNKEVDTIPRTPPTRGWTLVHRAGQLKAVQNPAYAGMDLAFFVAVNGLSTEPRLRGDGPLTSLAR